MRTTLRALMLGLGLLSFHIIFSQQVAKRISYPSSPDGIIGFLEFRPSDYGSQRHPLIIFLHGIGERGNGSSQINTVANNGIPNLCARGASMRFTVGGQTSSFVVLSPQLSTQYGYWPTFYVKELIKYAKANLEIDPDRIYITGLSLGGGGVWRVITEAENWDYSFDAGIAAVAPVCGTQEENDYDFCNTIGANHLPIWAFHSMDDGTVGVGATQHAEILAKNCGVTPAPLFTYYQSGGHGGAWVNAYDTGHITRNVMNNGRAVGFTASPNMYEWFLSQSRSTGAGRPSYTAPIANAGVAQTITLPLNLVTLSGSGTGTNGASIVSYSWEKTSGPAGGVITLPLLNTSLVTGLVQGTYVFTLTVTDNHGLTSSSSVSITVNGLLNQTPSASAGNGGTITLPNNSLTLYGSAADPDGWIASYNWSKTSGPSSYTIVNPGSPTTIISNLAAGTYVFTLKATDNAGASATSSVTINVNAAANQPPIAYAGANASITLPTNSVSVDGGASFDPDGSIVAWYWAKESGPSSYSIADATAPRTTISNLVQGTYVFTLQVRDNAGTVSFSTVTVTVNPAYVPPPPAPVNQTPVSNAGNNATITLPANSVNVDASGSYDPDGSIVAYWWVQDSGPSWASIADQAAVRTTIGNLVQGVYVFTLQVRDNAGVIGFSKITITVNQAYAAPSLPVNQTPVSNAGGNVTITLPNNSVQADGGSSYDPDGTVVAYWWVQDSGPSAATISEQAGVKTNISNLVQGTYVFTLQVRDNSGIIGFSTKTITVNAAPPAATEQPIGYIKVSTGPGQACDDASTAGRFAIYTSSIAKGSLVYLDAAHTLLFDGGWNWYSFTPAWGGAVTQAFAIYPNGGMDLITNCSGSPAPPPPPPPATSLLGYIKLSTGPNMACDDASTTGRIAIYGKSIANGSFVYADAAMTQKFDGGWNWYSFTPVLGGPVTQAFAIYPIGSIGMLTTCTANARMMVQPPAVATTLAPTAAAVPAATLANASSAVKLSMYPNPVRGNSAATVELNSADNSTKTINVYNSNGTLKATYKWPVQQGNNKFSLNNVAGLNNGLYIIDIRDSNNAPVGKLKFIKL